MVFTSSGLPTHCYLPEILQIRLLFWELDYVINENLIYRKCVCICICFKSCPHNQNIEGNWGKPVRKLLHLIFFWNACIHKRHFSIPKFNPIAITCVCACMFVISVHKSIKNIQPLYPISHQNTDCISGNVSLTVPQTSIWFPPSVSFPLHSTFRCYHWSSY